MRRALPWRRLALAAVLAGAPPAAGPAASQAIGQAASPAAFRQSCYFDRGSLTLNAACRAVLLAAQRVWQEERDWQAGPPPPRRVPAPGERPWSGLPPQLLVRGHAQDQRGPELDEQLSLRRAAAVARALEALGIPAAQLEVEGFGSRAAEAVEGGPHPANRRVDILLPQ